MVAVTGLQIHKQAVFSLVMQLYAGCLTVMRSTVWTGFRMAGNDKFAEAIQNATSDRIPGAQLGVCTCCQSAASRTYANMRSLHMSVLRLFGDWPIEYQKQQGCM